MSAQSGDRDVQIRVLSAKPGMVISSHRFSPADPEIVMSVHPLVALGDPGRTGPLARACLQLTARVA